MKSKITAILAAALLLFAFSRAQAEPLKISAFITAQDLTALLKDDAGRKQALDILKPIGVTKVYLDTYRGGLITDPQLLKTVRDFFKSNGFEVSGGITTTQGPGFGKGSTTHPYWLCYNYSETRNDIRKVMGSAAGIFDEIIVDDFLATDCRCPECDQLRGSRSWPEFFRDLLVDVSREDIVTAAKKVNPKTTVIIKYPQWYDRFHVMGYDVARQPGIFDLVYVGTETRDPRVERVQQYEAFVNFTWLKSLGGPKTRGAWFDWINCYPEVYMEQAYQSVFAGAEEIVLFGYSPKEFTTDNLRRFTQKRPELLKMANFLAGKQRQGVIGYKPANSDHGADTYIYDFIGMLGVPVVMSASFPEDSRPVFLSEHALADPEIADKIIGHMNKGGTIVMTGSFLAGMKEHKDVLAAAGVQNSEIKKSSKRMTTEFELADGTKIKAPGYVVLAATMNLSPSAKILASASLGGKLLPFLFISEIKNGKIVVLNTRTYELEPESRSITTEGGVLVPNIPVEIATLMRNQAIAPLGIKADFPNKTGLYLYGDDAMAVENFNDDAITTGITAGKGLYPQGIAKVKDIITGEEFTASGGALEIPIPARTPRVLQVVE